MAWNGSGISAGVGQSQSKSVHKPIALRWFVRVLVSVAVVGCVVCAFIIFRSDATAEQERSSVKTAAQARKLRKNPGRYIGSPEEVVRRAMPLSGPEKVRRKRVRPVIELFGHLSGLDRKLSEAVQAALDDDDLHSAISAVKASLKSENPEVRQNAVEALGWFGADALPELTGCLADRDEDIRRAALNQWEQSVQEIENAEDRFCVVAAAFATLTGEDELSELGGLLCGAATEMIDDETDEAVTGEKRVMVLQSLVDIIEDGQAKNVEAAAEAYRDITGNDWLGIEEAERYLSDPENYDPDGSPMAADPSAGNEANDMGDDSVGQGDGGEGELQD